MSYIVGRPVSGSDFYGRKVLVDRIYQGSEWATWIIGGRRIGKTSVLHQINYYTLNDPDKVALFCNWHPARSPDSLKDILLQSAQDSESISASKLNIAEVDAKGKSFDEILKSLVRQAHRQEIQIFLLIDEPEDILFELAQSAPLVLKQLRSSMLQGKALHTVITSGPRLRELNNLGWQTSPFWEGFDRAYIGAIERADAINLIQRTQSDQSISVTDELANSILEQTGQIPWLIQSVCRKIEPVNKTSQVPDAVWSTREHDDRFETDYRMLSKDERHILRSIGMAQKTPLALSDIAQGCEMPEFQVLPILFQLVQLGYIEKTHTELYCISNHFLKEWLRFGLWKKCEDEESHITNNEETSGHQTASPMSRPTVFISYSSKDEKEKDLLMAHLGVLESANLIELWSDDQIDAGADWKAEINRSIAQANVAILLISANFLTTDFILDKEVPALLQRREREGLIIFPVIARDCVWNKIDWLSKMQVRPKNKKPVWSDAGRHADEYLAAISEEVAITLADRGH